MGLGSAAQWKSPCLAVRGSELNVQHYKRRKREKNRRDGEGEVSDISGILHQKVNNVQINVKGELR